MQAVFLDRDTVDAGDMDLSPLEDVLDDWEYYGHTSPDQVVERIGQAQVVVTNKVVLDGESMADCPDLELVCVAATGTNNVDLEAARNLGLTVCNVRGYSTPSVVQHVFALLLALATRLPQYHDAVSRGRWSESRHFTMLDWPIRELAGCKLGIIGHGAIGGEVGKVSKALGMEVLVARRGPEDKRRGRVTLAELLREADAVTVHCPLTAATEGLLGAEELAAMKPGAFLINTARGGIVDEAALADALREGHLGGAGVDVLPEEPPPADHPLLAADVPNLIVTPHVAWTSQAARQRLVRELAENVRAYLAGESRNVVSA